MLMNENKLFMLWPMYSFISGIMPLNSKYYNNLQNKYIASQQSFSSSSLQQLFKTPKLRKNQKTNTYSFLNQNNKYKLFNQNKRVHGLSLLRSFEYKPLTINFNNPKILNRHKRLHNLSLLRQLNIKSSSLTPVYRNYVENDRILSRQKRLHSLSLLRKFGTKPTYNNLRNNIKKNRQRRNLNNLTVLRLFNIKNFPTYLYNFETDKTNKKKIQSKIKRIHNLSLLRDCNNKIICLIKNFYNNHQRVRRRTKRVHNLSLLRYDGKLFQNLFAPNVETNFPSNVELKNQRFEQKRFSLLLNKLKNKQKNNFSAYYLN